MVICLNETPATSFMFSKTRLMDYKSSDTGSQLVLIFVHIAEFVACSVLLAVLLFLQRRTLNSQERPYGVANDL